MSGAVQILPERAGVYVVACFNTDCPEHGTGTYAAPWVDEFITKREAEVCAKEHRAYIRDYWAPDCPTCGQRVKGAAMSTTHAETEETA